MSTKLSAEQLEYWHNSVEGDQDVDDEYETTVGEITALLDHITAQESELKAAQYEAQRLPLIMMADFRAQLVEAVRGKGWPTESVRSQVIQLISTFEPEKV